MLKYTNTTKPSAKLLSDKTPQVLFTRDAIHKMECYIEGHHQEIGWLNAAKRNEEGDIVIYDAFLFKQEVHATTTEITPEGLSEFGMDLLSQEGGMDLWNDIRCWGHSHVHMQCTPSAQDNAQMVEFSKSGFPWFVRIIGNKKGDMRVDLFDYAARIEYSNLQWSVLPSQNEEVIYVELDAINEEYDKAFAALEAHFQERINPLEKQIDDIIVAEKAAYKAEITAEIKEKVKHKTYHNPNVVYGRNQITPYAQGTNAGSNLPIDEHDLKKNGTSVGTNVVGSRPILEVVSGNANSSSDVDVISNIYVDYYKFFDYGDAHIIEDYSDDLDALQTKIWDSGIHVQFSVPDLRKIVAFARGLIYQTDWRN